MTTPAWLQTMLLGNTVMDWAVAVAWALGVTAAVLLLRSVVSRRLAVLAARTDTVADDAVIEAVKSVRKTYVLLIATGIAFSWLHFPGAAHTAIRRALIIIAVLQAIRTGNVVVDFLAARYATRKEGLDRTTLRALSYAGRFLLIVAVVLVGLEASGFEVKTLLTGLGVGGIAIALAVQNILGDLFAAMSIVLDKPFIVGDAIAVDNFEGDVVHIGLKSTRVRSVNGEEVVFANADLLKSRLRNLTRRHGRRYVITLLLAPATPVERIGRVPAFIADAVADTAGGRATLQRSHLIAAGLTGPEVETSIFIPGLDFIEAFDIRQAVLLGILHRLEKEGIMLARSATIAP